MLRLPSVTASQLQLQLPSTQLALQQKLWTHLAAASYVQPPQITAELGSNHIAHKDPQLQIDKPQLSSHRCIGAELISSKPSNIIGLLFGPGFKMPVSVDYSSLWTTNAKAVSIELALANVSRQLQEHQIGVSNMFLAWID